MIGIDTDVLVRYLSQDDEQQSARATAFIEALDSETRGFVSIVVLVEIVWVLARAYKTPRSTIADTVDMLLRTSELVVEQAPAARLALAAYRSSRADFADAVIAQAGRLAGCRETVTFDRAAATGAGMRLLQD